MLVSGWIVFVSFSAFFVKNVLDGFYLEAGTGAILFAHLSGRR